MSLVASRRWFAAALALGLSLALPQPAAAKWRTYADCRLIPNPANDGDSFHTKRGRKHDIFRLYFVDTPETDDTLEERIDEQAAYWGLAPQQMHRLGEQAKAFTAEFLKDGFTVTTQFEDARGNSDRERHYAFVRIGDDRDQDLAIALVGAGLARVYGRMVAQPDGLSLERYKIRLEAAERHARQQKLGAWGVKPDPRAKAQAGSAQAGAAESGAAANPAFARAPTLGPRAWTNVPVREVQLARAVPIYSLRTTNLVTTLKPGTTVRTLKAETPALVRIRFSQDGKVYEAMCKRSDLPP